MNHYSRCSNEIIDVHGKFLNGSCFDNGKFNNTNGFKYLLFVNNYLGRIFYVFQAIEYLRLFIVLVNPSLKQIYCSLNKIIRIVFTTAFPFEYFLFSEKFYFYNLVTFENY